MADTKTAVARPAGEAHIRRFFLAPGGGVPNNSNFPAVYAPRAIDALPSGPSAADALRSLLEGNGWGGTWTWEVFTFHHFHPDAFEALVVASGSATLMLGGPSGKTVALEVGDALMLPPGVGHCQIEKRDDFRICGAYPPGQEDYTVARADEGCDGTIERALAAVPRPRTDPVWGGGGPLLQALVG